MTVPTMPFSDRAEFDAAVAAAREAASAYYDTAVMVMPDADYDLLADRIAATIAVNPDWDDRGLTTEVAAGASAGGDVVHPTPMLSLDKVKTRDDLDAFVVRLADQAVVEVKLDGLAVRAEYRDGRLALVATRGDGSTGEDVTVQAMRDGGIAGLPIVLSAPFTGEVRGEVYMTDTDFAAANANRVAAGGKAFVNARNATAGALRTQTAVAATPMTFAAYEVAGDQADEYTAHSARMTYAGSLGFATAYELTRAAAGGEVVVGGADEVLAVVDAIEKARPTLGYQIDGAVIKAETDAARDRLGMASRTPYWAAAFKYPPDTGFSVLRAIEVAVGRTGRASFRAVIDPVFVGGSTITYASLHNAPWIVEQGLAIGMKVAVIRAGDVIPRVTAAVGEQPDGLTAWQPPTACPQCDQEWDTSSLLWRCHTASCAAVNALVYWCSREALDVERIGDSICEALVEQGLATTVADLYELTVDDLANLPMGTTSTGAVRRLGLANATEIVAQLEASKAQPLNRVITGLGIRMTGRSVGRWLAARFRSMAALRAATVEEIAEIDKMGLIKAQAVVDGLVAMAPVIDRLAAHGLTMEVVDDGGHRPWDGKKVVVSGSVPGMSRTQAQEAAARLGATVSGSVSRNTDLLVAGDGAGSKLAKAQELSVEVMTAEDFAALYTATFTS
ncbi:NAD-dependent DNA ligase LigA [Luedemannella helvata]|uniref:DNA ligase n=1 Tax=Luedemannella helvata TaxID=349315 RepID=A0ABP4X1D6_9ACTN